MAGECELVEKVCKELPRVAAVLWDFRQDSFLQKQFSMFVEPEA